MKRPRQHYRVSGSVNSLGTLCKSMTEALDLARHLLKQGFDVRITKE